MQDAVRYYVFVSHRAEPYELPTDNGARPTDEAWQHIARFPIERYPEYSGEELPETNARWVSIHMRGLAERESAFLANIHADALEPHYPTLRRMWEDLVEEGMDEGRAKHLVEVFALGILVGAKAVEITKQHDWQGTIELKNL